MIVPRLPIAELECCSRNATTTERRFIQSKCKCDDLHCELNSRLPRAGVSEVFVQRAAEAVSQRFESRRYYVMWLIRDRLHSTNWSEFFVNTLLFHCWQKIFAGQIWPARRSSDTPGPEEQNWKVRAAWSKKTVHMLRERRRGAGQFRTLAVAYGGGAECLWRRRSRDDWNNQFFRILWPGCFFLWPSNITAQWFVTQVACTLLLEIKPRWCTETTCAALGASVNAFVIPRGLLCTYRWRGG